MSKWCVKNRLNVVECRNDNHFFSFRRLQDGGLSEDWGYCDPTELLLTDISEIARSAYIAALEDQNKLVP